MDIKSKPYGLYVSNFTIGVITTQRVELSTVVYIPAIGQTSAAVTLADMAGDVFWYFPPDVTFTDAPSDYFSAGIKVNGIQITNAPSDTASSLVIKLK